MERILLGALLITLFVSCGKSPEEKANALIEDDIKKVLYHPETYDPAETQVDSAFTPFDDPAFYEKTVQLCKLGMSIDECDIHTYMGDGNPLQCLFGVDHINLLLGEMNTKKQKMNMTRMSETRKV